MILGLDVSVWQDANTTPQKINFQKMKDELVNFVYIRGAFGVTVDEDFADNWRAAKATGLLRGVYFFFDYRPGAPSAATQIEFWMKLIKDDPGELPPALDFEQPNSSWPELPARAVCLDVIWQFDNAVKTKLGLSKSVLYTNPALILARLNPAPDWLTEIPLWCANWYANAEYVLKDEKGKWKLPWKKWTFWQWGLGKGEGPKYGVESLDVDMDYFNGDLEELRAFAGVSAPMPEDPQPEPEVPEESPMSMYDSYPKGVMLTNHKSDPAKIGGDFMLAYMGKGLTKYASFHDQVQAAFDADKPLIAVYDNDPLVMIQQYESLNLAKWKAEIADNYVIKQVLGPMIQAGGVNRRIHAVIITMNDIYEAPGKISNSNWIYQTALALAYGVNTLYELPVYLSIDAEIAKVIPHGIDDVFTTFLSKLVDFDEELQRGYEGVAAGIGTYFNAPSVPVSGTWDAIPVPPDSFNEEFRTAKRESGLGNAPRVHFWCYSTGRVTMPGVTGVAPLYMYMGSKDKLYRELNYTPASGEQPDPEPDPEPEPEPTPDSNSLVAALDRNTAMLKRLVDWLER